jgi:hypothetical protein
MPQERKERKKTVKIQQAIDRLTRDMAENPDTKSTSSFEIVDEGYF